MPDRPYTTLALIGCLVLTTTACITSERQQIFYLEPDGSVTWSIHEREMRSDLTDEAERRQEEAELRQALVENRYDVRRAFHELGAVTADTQWIRRQIPFAVVTTGTFESPESLFDDLLSGLGFHVTVTSRRDATTREISILIFSDTDTDPADDSPLWSLIDGLDKARFVLPEGEFVYARGFDIDGSVATFADFEDTRAQQCGDDEKCDEPVELRLLWSLTRLE